MSAVWWVGCEVVAVSATALPQGISLSLLVVGLSQAVWWVIWKVVSGISNSIATGDISVSASGGPYAGGLVGYISSNSSISNSIATGDVSTSRTGMGNLYAGGLVGFMQTNSAASATVLPPVMSSPPPPITLPRQMRAVWWGFMGNRSHSISNSTATGDVLCLLCKWIYTRRSGGELCLQAVSATAITTLRRCRSGTARPEEAPFCVAWVMMPTLLVLLPKPSARYSRLMLLLSTGMTLTTGLRWVRRASFRSSAMATIRIPVVLTNVSPCPALATQMTIRCAAVIFCLCRSFTGLVATLLSAMPRSAHPRDSAPDFFYSVDGATVTASYNLAMGVTLTASGVEAGRRHCYD